MALNEIQRSKMGYAAMRKRVDELTRRLNLLTQMEVVKIDYDGDPKFHYSDEAIRLDFPYYEGLQEEIDQIKQDIEELETSLEELDDRIDYIQSATEVAEVPDDIDPTTAPPGSDSTKTWELVAWNAFTNSAAQRVTLQVFQSVTTITLDGAEKKFYGNEFWIGFTSYNPPHPTLNHRAYIWVNGSPTGTGYSPAITGEDSFTYIQRGSTLSTQWAYQAPVVSNGDVIYISHWWQPGFPAIYLDKIIRTHQVIDAYQEGWEA